MTSRPPTAAESGILDATLRAITKGGLRGLSITEICREAQISRGTVYRYFSNRAEVLEFLGEHMVKRYEGALAAAIATEPKIEDRFRVVVWTMFRQRHHPVAIQMAEAEADFLLAFFKKEFPRLVRITADALGTAVEESPPVRAGVLTRLQVAEILLRISTAASILPEGAPDDLPKVLSELWPPTVPGAGP